MGTGLFPFLDAIDVNYGPKIELGRYFLMLAETGRNVGVSLYLGRGFERLVEVNRENLDTWAALAPMYDPRYSDVTAENTVYIEGQHNGEPVMTLALRRYDWPETSLHEEWEAGRFAYRDPAVDMGAGEKWIALSPIAETITGRVAYTGGVWCRRDFRTKRLPVLLIALMRSVPLTLWNPDYSIGIIETGVLSRTLLPLYGHPNSQPGMQVKGGWRDVDCTLVWENREEVTRRVLDVASALSNHTDQRYGRNEVVRRVGAPG